MAQISKDKLQQYKYALRYLIVGALLFGIAFLIPRIGSDYEKSRSIFEVALSGKWGKLFEWRAMLCSLRIIFLSCGVCLFLTAFEEFMVAYKNKTLTIELLLISIVPWFLAFCLGVFFLIKGLF